MLSAKLTTKTVAKQPRPFFLRLPGTVRRDSGLAADHATGETFDRSNHGRSPAYRGVVAVRRGGVSICAWSSPALEDLQSCKPGHRRVASSGQRRYDHRDLKVIIVTMSDLKSMPNIGAILRRCVARAARHVGGMDGRAHTLAIWVAFRGVAGDSSRRDLPSGLLLAPLRACQVHRFPPGGPRASRVRAAPLLPFCVGCIVATQLRTGECGAAVGAARGALKPVLRSAFQSALKTGVNGHLRAATAARGARIGGLCFTGPSWGPCISESPEPPQYPSSSEYWRASGRLKGRVCFL